MAITAARLQAEVGAETKDFDKGFAHADKTVAAAPAKWGKALKVGAGLGLGLAAGVVVKGVVGAISAGVTSLRDTGVVVAQTQAVIKSTGGAAKVTADQIRELSEKTESLTAIDDKAVQAGANMLLTFTNIRNEVGAGNDIFNQSVGILADMSTAMGTDMKGGAIQLGKALNDPLAGITALTRVGVTFSDQQKQQIENFQKAGKTAEAQKVILAELNKEFGGSGAAFAATDAGKAAKFQDAIEGIQQSVAKGLLPAITRVRGQLTNFLDDPATLGQAEALGNAIASIFSEGNLRTAASLMTSAAGAISTAIKLFSSLPPQVQALAVGAIALKKITGIGPLDIAKGATGLLKIAFQRGETPANPLYVSAVGLSGGTGAIPAGGGSKLGGVASAVGKVFIIGAAVGVFAELSGILKDQSAANQTGIGGLDKQTRAFTGGASLADLKQSLAGVDAQITGLQNSLSPEALAYQFNIDGIRTAVERERAELVAAIKAQESRSTVLQTVASERAESLTGRQVKVSEDAAMAARRTEAAENRVERATWAAGAKTVGALVALQTSFRADLAGLRKATEANDIQKFARAIAADITKGVGSAEGTKGVIADLKVKLAQTDDPKTRSVLQAAIKAVQAKLPNREWVSGQFHKADAILKSSDSTKTKIVDLTAIQRTLRDRGDTHAASVIGQKITTLKTSTDKIPASVSKLSADTRSEGITIAAAARTAGDTTAAAVDRKKWQFTSNITVPVTVHSQVSLRSYSTATSTAVSRGNVFVPS